MAKLKPKTINKQVFKKIQKVCRICGEDDYNLLDVHRIVPGAKGGKYDETNSCCLCSNCHRKIHADEIIIDKYYTSTKGKLLRIVIDGEERFI